MYLFGQILILEIVMDRFCETVYNYIYQYMYINFQLLIYKREINVPFKIIFLEGYI